jgi:hypothetical protein
MTGSKHREAMRRDHEKGIFHPLDFVKSKSYLRVKAAREAKREVRETANMVVGSMLLLVE